MSYGAARAFGTARAMHICSRYAAVSIANTSLYYGALQLRQLCALVMLRRYAPLHRHSAQLFLLRTSVLVSQCLRALSTTFTWAPFPLGKWRPRAHDSFQGFGILELSYAPRSRVLSRPLTSVQASLQWTVSWLWHLDTAPGSFTFASSPRDLDIYIHTPY